MRDIVESEVVYRKNKRKCTLEVNPEGLVW